MMFQHERLAAYNDALELLEHVRRAVDALPKGCRSFGKRVLVAGSNLVVGIASAIAQPSAGAKRRALRSAILFATKCAALLDVLRKLALIGEEEHSTGKKIAERVARSLSRQVRALDRKQSASNRPAVLDGTPPPEEIRLPQGDKAGAPPQVAADTTPLLPHEGRSNDDATDTDANGGTHVPVPHPVQLLRGRSAAAPLPPMQT
jgi:hypothetical protein